MSTGTGQARASQTERQVRRRCNSSEVHLRRPNKCLWVPLPQHTRITPCLPLPPSSELQTQPPRTGYPMRVPQAWPAPGKSQSRRVADRDRAGEGGGEVGTATQWGFLEVDPPQLSVCKEIRYGKGIPGREQGLQRPRRTCDGSFSGAEERKRAGGASDACLGDYRWQPWKVYEQGHLTEFTFSEFAQAALTEGGGAEEGRDWSCGGRRGGPGRRP